MSEAAEGERDPVAQWLAVTPLLARLCTQNGWVDADSLRYEVRERDDQRVLLNVCFSEIVMEGAGCVADRIECFGQIELMLDHAGGVAGARLV